MANLVGTKGQVVIEKELRDQLGIKPGWRAIQKIVDGRLEIRFRPPEHNRSVAGILARKGRRSTTKDDEWYEIEERAWEEAVREDWSEYLRQEAEEKS
jgi:AbrB family looped-hinge helix DNA binding protein